MTDWSYIGRLVEINGVIDENKQFLVVLTSALQLAKKAQYHAAVLSIRTISITLKIILLCECVNFA